MNNWQDLEAYLKIVYQNFSVLHHCMTGHGFFVIHPLMAEFYDKAGEINDSLIEHGMVEGIMEPGIKDAVLAYGSELVPVAPIECEDAVATASEEFGMIITKMNALRVEVTPDMQSQIDAWVFEIQTYQYKIRQYLGAKHPEPEDEE